MGYRFDWSDSSKHEFRLMFAYKLVLSRDNPDDVTIESVCRGFFTVDEEANEDTLLPIAIRRVYDYMRGAIESSTGATPANRLSIPDIDAVAVAQELVENRKKEQASK